MKILSSSLTLLIFAVLCLSGCQQEEDATPITAPEIDYSPSTFRAFFLTPGNSSIPTIDWNGQRGQLSLANEPDGVAIDPNSGEISWVFGFLPGPHQFTVIASNEGGQTIEDVTINCRMSGSATGLYDNFYYYKLIFEDDDSITIEANDQNTPELASGSYSFAEDGSFYSTYTYSNNSERIELRGQLQMSRTTASLSGTWANLDFPSQNGTFELDFD